MTFFRALLALATIPLFLAAQPAPDTLWTRTIPSANMEMAYDIQPTSDGLIIGGARFTTSYGFGDFYLVKTDPQGQVLWSRTYGYEGDEQPYCVRQTPGGGYIFAGMSNTFCEGLSDFSDIYIVATDANGDTLWTKMYDFSSNDEADHIECTADGGFIVAALTHPDPGTEMRLCLLKLDANGDTLWTRYYGDEWSTYAQSVRPTSDGGYIIGGRTLEPGGGGQNFLVIKTDGQGNEQWNRIFGGDMPDELADVIETADGGFAVAGSKYVSSDVASDFCLIKLSAAGDSLWQVVAGNPGAWSDECRAMTLAADGGFVLSGSCFANWPDREQCELMKVSADGELEWQAFCAQPPDFCGSWGMCVTSNHGFVEAGIRRRSDQGGGQGHIFLVRYEPEETPNRTGNIAGNAASFGLGQNYPNPFNPRTSIAFTLSGPAAAMLEVFDLTGRQVMQTKTGMLSSGAHQVQFDGSSLPSGTYLYRLRAGARTETRKMLLLK